MTASILRLMLPTDECFIQEVPEPVYDGLTCPKYALWDSNPGSWLAKEQSHGFALEVGGYCSWTMRPGVVIHIHRPCTGLVASGWLSKWGTTTGCKTSLMYWSPVRLPCMMTKSSLQSWEIHPKPLLSLHRKGELAGCSLGYRLYFCVSKPSSGRGLHEAEPGSRLTNGSCTMSLNSYHVVLNTMPNVIVDIGLLTEDV
jgi:hypothetical protein